MDTAEAKAALRSFNSQAGSAGKGAAKSFEEANKGAMIFTGSLRRMVPIMAGMAGLGAGGGIFARALGSASEIEQLSTQFNVLLGSMEATTARMEEMKRFALETPFEIPDIARASRILEVLTKGALSTGEGLRMVGDAAAGSGARIENLSMWFGRLYDGLQSGRPVGEAMMRLQELGIISGGARNEIEEMSNAGVEGARIWEVVTKEVSRFDGMMIKMSKTLAGAGSNFKDNFNMLLAELGKEALPGITSALTGLNGIMADTTKFVQNLKATSSGAPWWVNIIPGYGQMNALSNVVGALSVDEHEVRRAEDQLAKMRAMAAEHKKLREEQGTRSERDRAALGDFVRRENQEWRLQQSLRQVWRGGDPFRQLIRGREEALQRLNDLRQEFDKAETSQRDRFINQLEKAAEDLEAARKALQEAQAKAIMGATVVGMNVGGIGGPTRPLPGFGFGISGAIMSAMGFAQTAGVMANLMGQRNEMTAGLGRYRRFLATAGGNGVRGGASRSAQLALLHGDGSDGLDHTNSLLEEINEKIDKVLTVK